MKRIHVFTKKVEKKLYDPGLANSIHFELSENGEVTKLNQDYGVLFVKGEVRPDNGIAARGALNPYLIKDGASFLVVCDYVDEAGENMAIGKWYAWKTADFVEFETVGLIDKFDCELSDSIEIPDGISDGILKRWVAPYGLNVKKAREFSYPLVRGFADPVVFTWQGKWYFLATNDLNGNIGIFMREASTVDGLFTDEHKLCVILDYNEEKEFIQTFWAPEWHIIGGVPYILFAVGGHQWAPHSHMMKYKGVGDIMDANSWECPIRVRKKDGSFLCTDGITLDMTYVKDGGRSYVLWSERYHINAENDSGSMIYIASVDEKNPTVLTSDKILLTRPLYGWENVEGTINNEGPYCIIRNGKVIVTYSGGAACGHYYAVGALIADCGADLLDVSCWKKLQTPFFNAYTLEGVDGPGHSSFFVDENGDDMIAFHGQDNGRVSAIHSVYFLADGTPVVF